MKGSRKNVDEDTPREVALVLPLQPRRQHSCTCRSLKVVHIKPETRLTCASTSSCDSRSNVENVQPSASPPLAHTRCLQPGPLVPFCQRKTRDRVLKCPTCTSRTPHAQYLACVIPYRRNCSKAGAGITAALVIPLIIIDNDAIGQESSPYDSESASHDCPLFCVFCRTEVYEKTARPRTFSPGKPRAGRSSSLSMTLEIRAPHNG